MAYHKAVKGVCGMTPEIAIMKHVQRWESTSSYICMRNDAMGLHLPFGIQIESPCLVHLLYYLRHRLAFSRHNVEYFRSAYELPKLFDNPVCASRTSVDFS